MGKECLDFDVEGISKADQWALDYQSRKTHHRIYTGEGSTHLKEIEMMLDEIDQQILNGRVEQYDKRAGSRVGDWVLLAGEKEMRRLTYDWGDSIQTGCVAGDSGSFYLGNGYISYSGALDPSIPKAELVQIDEVRVGRVWIFHRDFAQAGGGVEAEIPFRVFKQIASPDERA